MGPKGRKYHKEYALEIFAIAKQDLQSARVLAAAPDPGRPETILFLAQQAVEKALKALLCFHGQEILHTHDLDVLLFALSKITRVPRAQEVGSLTQFALVRRYEQGKEILDADDIAAAIVLAEDIIEWTSREISFATT